MRTEAVKRPPVVQWLAMGVATVMIASLVKLGETELAVGLIPSPWDKLAHMATFGTIAFSLWLALGQRWLYSCAVFAFAIALYDEWRQLTLPGREADLADLLANGVGIVLAVLLARYIVARGIRS
nr:VanZ family protein [Methyloversatilis sp. XJ19-13]